MLFIYESNRRSKVDIYKLQCIDCGADREFGSKYIMNRAIKMNRLRCKSCGRRKLLEDKTKHPMYGKFGDAHSKFGFTESDETRQKKRERMLK